MSTSVKRVERPQERRFGDATFEQVITDVGKRQNVRRVLVAALSIGFSLVLFVLLGAYVGNIAGSPALGVIGGALVGAAVICGIGSFVLPRIDARDQREADDVMEAFVNEQVAFSNRATRRSADRAKRRLHKKRRR